MNATETKAVNVVPNSTGVITTDAATQAGITLGRMVEAGPRGGTSVDESGYRSFFGKIVYNSSVVRGQLL